MNIDKRSIIELVGMIGIIASLIFVGMQLQLDRNVAISSQYQARTVIATEFIRSQFESPEYVEGLAEVYEQNRPDWWNDEIEAMYDQFNVPMELLIRLIMNARIQIYGIDNHYYQYRNGFLDEDTWQNIRLIVEDGVQNPVLRTAYNSTTGLSPEMKELITSMEAELGIQ